MIENVDYSLIAPKEAVDNDQAWDVRILTGEFVESIIRFGNVQVDGTTGEMRFNFFVVESIDTDLDENNEDLQIYAGELLYSLIEKSIKDGTAIIDGKHEPQPRTDNLT